MSLYEEMGASAEVALRLEAYAADLLRWGRAVNLISRKKPESEVHRLIGECLGVGLWLERRASVAGPWADLGSGAGFPGIVFACLDPDLEIDLIERRQGRCDFLRREVAALGLRRARVVEADARKVSGEGGGYSLVSLKAVAPPDQALALASPLTGPGGQALIFQRPDWGPPAGWAEVDRWVGRRGPVDLRDRAAVLVRPDVPRGTSEERRGE